MLLIHVKIYTNSFINQGKKMKNYNPKHIKFPI